jgi:hypothetical protein
MWMKCYQHGFKIKNSPYSEGMWCVLIMIYGAYCVEIKWTRCEALFSHKVKVAHWSCDIAKQVELQEIIYSVENYCGVNVPKEITHTELSKLKPISTEIQCNVCLKTTAHQWRNCYFWDKFWTQQLLCSTDFVSFKQGEKDANVSGGDWENLIQQAERITTSNNIIKFSFFLSLRWNGWMTISHGEYKSLMRLSHGDVYLNSFHSVLRLVWDLLFRIQIDLEWCKSLYLLEDIYYFIQ